MKKRQDFVTNSSSASYIICFARIADEKKAQAVIEKHNIKMLDVAGVNGEKNWCGELGADWCGAVIWGVDRILEAHPDDKYIIITDYNDAAYDEDYEPVYDYDFEANDTIAEITEENGFVDIEVAEGEGRDG